MAADGKLIEVNKPKLATLRKLATATAETAAADAGALVQNSAELAQKGMESSMEQVNKAGETAFKAAEQAADFGRGNVEAFTKAAQVYMAGVQDLGRQTMAMVQGLTDHALENAKALTSVKSLKEASEIQAAYIRVTFEKTMSETVKLHESAVKVAEQAFAPLSARMTLAMEKAGRPLAA